MSDEARCPHKGHFTGSFRYTQLYEKYNEYRFRKLYSKIPSFQIWMNKRKILTRLFVVLHDSTVTGMMPLEN